ncbi:hypothetical protein BFW01_g11122 [Lasiodiplodia theobromae]|uniref:uncharacterized protein n=1 Tax=Lasiodiplodia theobromae TaxID=45133 RepID=UPI0015C3BD09|nr:uncharacterized protein LTHEOB_10165 [Lasiodiplodia theobromae]KAF4539502.1 hypothetical protein LTHEOB_10165 [Lasiodiplodia theobromae]KAF9639316.1 hypothetical protein BFW01_g11122 [Lasiodiplodia theobromae]
MSRENADRDAKRNEVGELIQKTTEVNRTIVELDAQLAHVAAQLNDKRTRGKDERIIIKKFFGKDEGSMSIENKALVKLREEDVKGMQNVLKKFEESMYNEIKQIYSETVTPAEVAEEIERHVDENSEIGEYCRWLKENVPIDEKEKDEMKQKLRQLLKGPD